MNGLWSLTLMAFLPVNEHASLHAQNITLVIFEEKKRSSVDIAAIFISFYTL